MEKQHDTASDFSGHGAKKGSSGKHQSALLNIGAVHTHFGHVQVSSPHLHHTLLEPAHFENSLLCDRLFSHAQRLKLMEPGAPMDTAREDCWGPLKQASGSFALT